MKAILTRVRYRYVVPVFCILAGGRILAQSPAPLTLSLTQLQFPTSQTGSVTTPEWVNITNNSNASVSGISISTSGDFSTKITCHSTLKPGASCQVSVTFAPVAAGLRTGSLSLTYNGAAAPTVLNLSGQAYSLTSIAITAASASVPVGSGRHFHAVGSYSDGSIQEITSSVTWTSSDNTKLTVTSSGLAAGIAAGNAQLTAACMGVTGSTNVNVTSATLVSLAVDTAHLSVPQGYAQQFNAVGTYSDGTQLVLSDQVTWTSSAHSVASVDLGGIVTSLGAGSSLITATFGAVSSSAALTVTGVTLQSLAITPATISMARATILQLQATGTYSDGSMRNLTSVVAWSSSAANIATVSAGGRLSSNGPAGAALISANFAGVSASAPATLNAVRMRSISVSPGKSSLPAGVTQKFIATGNFSDGSWQDVSLSVHWVSSAGTFATVSNSYQAEGVTTTWLPGSVTVSASYMPSVSGSAAVTVDTAALVSIAITPANLAAATGTALQFKAMGTYDDQSTHNVTSTVTWSTTNPTTLLISNDPSALGLGYGLAPGQNTVSATLGGLTGTTPFSISTPTLIAINVNPPSADIVAGMSQQLSAAGTFADGSVQDLSQTANWSSSAAAATVGNSPGIDGLAVGVAAGQATITATYNNVSGASQVNVTPAQLVGIAVTPNGAAVTTGNSQQYTALGTYTDSTTQDLTATAAWSASPPATATISGTSAGLAQGLAAGEATVTAAVGTIAGSTVLTINPSPLNLTSITINPSTVTVFAGSSQQYTATGTYADGSTQDLTATVDWSGTPATVATISDAAGSQGLAQSASAGTATITATAGTVSATAQLMVVPLLTSITVSPASASLNVGGTRQFTATGVYSDNSTQDLTATVVWSASPAIAATIGNAPGTPGLAQAVAAGSATISASFASVTGAAALSISPVLVSIAVGPVDPTVTTGSNQQFSATGTYSDGSTQDITNQVTWSSAPSLIASINATGQALGLVPGQAMITAALGSVTNCTSMIVSVMPISLVSLTISPQSPTLFVGTTLQFLAIGTYSDGSTQDLSNTVTWSSTSPPVATISSYGLATGWNFGSTMIGASLLGINALNTQLSIVSTGPPPDIGELCQPAPTGLPTLPVSVTLPAPPQSCTVPVYPAAAGAPILVSTASDLQTALTNAQCGQHIQVQAGITYQGAFVVPALACPDDSPVLVENSAILATVTCTAQSGPPCSPSTAGQTIPVLPQWSAPSQSLAGSSYVPTIESPGNSSPFFVSDGAANWYFAGLEFTLSPASQFIYPIVAMGENTPTADQLPRNITFDRILVHPAPCPNDTIGAQCNYAARGVDLNAVNGTVMFSNIFAMVASGEDTQAINIANSTGPGLILGNYLEATGENLMFNTSCTILPNGLGSPPAGTTQGATGWLPGDDGMTTCPPPSDYTVRLNHFHKSLTWQSLPTGCDPTQSQCYDVKNDLEVKDGQRILVDSNVFDTTYSGGQSGFTTVNCWATGLYVCQDILYQNNYFEHGPSIGGFTGNGQPTTTPNCGGAGQPACTAVLAGNRIAFVNNVATDISTGFGGFQYCTNCSLIHNTIVNGLQLPNDNALDFSDAQPTTDPGFVFLNTFMFGSPFNNGGCPGCVFTGTNALPNALLGGDYFVGDYWGYPNVWGVTYTPAYPPGVQSLSSDALSNPSGQTPATTCQNSNSVISQCWPLDWALAGFVDFTGGSLGTDLAGLILSSTSPLHNSGTDGTDIGANVPAVISAISSVH